MCPCVRVGRGSYQGRWAGLLQHGGPPTCLSTPFLPAICRAQLPHTRSSFLSLVRVPVSSSRSLAPFLPDWTLPTLTALRSGPDSSGHARRVWQEPGEGEQHHQALGLKAWVETGSLTPPLARKASERAAWQAPQVPRGGQLPSLGLSNSPSSLS